MNEPYLIKLFLSAKINIVEIKKGQNHTLFVSEQRMLFGCGSNDNHQLGLPQTKEFTEIINLSQHMKLPSSFVLPIAEAHCTSHATCLVDADGRLFGVGSDFDGALGFGNVSDGGDFEELESVTKLNFQGRVQQLQCGGSFVCLMDGECRII